MRITKHQSESFKFDINKLEANIGCNKCPCCGEPQKYPSLICKTWVEGFFKMKHMKVNCYSCNSCGAEWESEPYQYA